jgi:hypothetical protein
MCVCVYVCVYVCVCLCVYVRAQAICAKRDTHTQIHTHIHTSTVQKKCAMQKKNTRSSPNRASFAAIDSQRRQLSAESIISVGPQDIAVCANILMRLGFRVWGLGKTRHKERSKPRASGGTRQPETPAICRINNISGAHTGARHIAVCANGRKRACAKKVRNA